MNPLAADLDHVLAHTEGLWEELRGGRLFITGGTGWFGCWLLESFAWANERLKLGAEVAVLTRDPAAFLRKMPHMFGRFLLFSSLKDARGHFTHVIHLEPTLPLFWPGTAKMLFVSSGAVYGKQHGGHVSEYAEAYPFTDYGRMKQYSEMIVRNRSHFDSLPVKIARPFTFIGPYMPLSDKFAAAAFLRDALAGGPIRVNDGSAVRSYLYCADLAIWLWTILFRGKPCWPYNVGSEDAVTISELAKFIASRCGVAVEDKTELSKHERYVPCTKRSREELGLYEWVTLSSAIDRTVRWCKERV